MSLEALSPWEHQENERFRVRRPIRELADISTDRGIMPEALVHSDLRSARAPRSLIIGNNVMQAPATFERFPGVVLLNITTRDTICTATLIGPAILITAPACFLPTEAPITAASAYDGSIANLTAYPVQLADASRTVIGFTQFHYYVYNTGQEGYRLSIVSISLTPAGAALNIPYYPIFMNEIIPPLAGVAGGYGPNNLTVSGLFTYPVGNGQLRMANVTLTGAGQSVKRIGKCSGYRIGGNLYVDRVARMAASYIRMCGQFGDMGSPLFLDFNGTMMIAGVLIDVDVYPCAVNKAIYTSVAFRQEWIITRVKALDSSVTFPVEYCPTASNTPTATITRSPSGTASPSMIINITIIVPPPPPPFPWWWIVTIGVAILVLLAVGVAVVVYVRRWFALMRDVTAYDKAAFTRPHPDHVSKAPDLPGFADPIGEGGSGLDHDPTNVADEIVAEGGPGGGPSAGGGKGGSAAAAAGAASSGYAAKVSSDEFLSRLQRRIQRKTARIAPSAPAADELEAPRSRARQLEARERNAFYASSAVALRPKFNPEAPAAGGPPSTTALPTTHSARQMVAAEAAAKSADASGSSPAVLAMLSPQRGSALAEAGGGGGTVALRGQSTITGDVPAILLTSGPIRQMPAARGGMTAPSPVRGLSPARPVGGVASAASAAPALFSPSPAGGSGGRDPPLKAPPLDLSGLHSL